MAKVEAIGGFFPMDEQGNIINPADRRLVSDVWHPVLNAFLQIYQTHFGTALKSMWIRGSLARGQVKADWSDIDVFALIDSDDSCRWEAMTLSRDQENYARQLLPEGFKSVQWEMMYSNFNEYKVNEMPRIAMLIKTQSLCWWGQDLESKLPLYQPGPDLLLNHRWLSADWTALQGKEDGTIHDYQGFLKTLIRTAFELVMAKVGRYTPDLYWCVQSFAQYYPQRGATLKKILNLYDQPLNGKHRLTTLLEEITPWIISESKRQFS